MNKEKIFTNDFIITWVTTFFIFTVFYSLIAIFPVYVYQSLDGDNIDSGLMIGVFLIAAVLFRPFAGKWLDQYDKRKILTISLVIFTLSTGLYLIIDNFLFLILLRFIHGAAFGVSSTATGAIVADVLSEKKKGEGIGYYALSYNVAMFVGPFLGLLILNNYSFNTLFFILFCISSCSLVFSCFIKLNLSSIESKVPVVHTTFWDSIIEKKAIPVALTAMFLSFSFSGFLTYIPIYASEISLDSIAGYFYIIFALFMVLCRPLIGKILDKYSSHYIIYPGIILYFIGLICLSLANSALLFLISAIIIGIGFGGLSPSLQSLAVKSTSKNRSGLATGTYLTFFDIGVGLGSFILGIIITHFNFKIMYLITSIIVLAAGCVYYLLYHRTKKNHGLVDAAN